MPIDQDRPCPHEHFAADADVVRLADGDNGHPETIIGYSVDLTIRCIDCGETFRFIGVPAGLSGGQPMCSIDEATIHLPIRPASSDPDFGMGIPGFAVAVILDEEL